MVGGVLATIMMSSLGMTASAQTQSDEALKPPTKVEAFLAKKGRLIVKDFHPLDTARGKYGTVKFDALTIYEPGFESQGVSGLRIEVSGAYEKSSISFLDLDEVESLASAIEYMLRLASEWTSAARDYDEVIFETKGDFQIGFYQEGAKQSAFCSSGRIGKVSCYFNSVADLGTVKSRADQALSVLRK